MKIPKYSLLAATLTLLLSLPVLVSAQPKLDSSALDAIQRSDVPALATWVANGGDVNWTAYNDNTLLMVASKIGDKQILEYLIAQNANVNARNKVGSTALMIAAKYGHMHVIEMLLDQGADPTIRNDSGISAARFALAYNYEDAYFHLQQAELVARAKAKTSS